MENNVFWVRNPEPVDATLRHGDTYRRLDAAALLVSGHPQAGLLRYINLTPDETALVIDIGIWKEEPFYTKRDELPFDVDIAFYAFRYCLGRATYVTGTMADYLIRCADRLDEKHTALIIKEIDEAIEKGQAGWQMDVDQWLRVKARLSAPVLVETTTGETVVCYELNGRYYKPDMNWSIAPEYIKSVAQQAHGQTDA